MGAGTHGGRSCSSARRADRGLRAAFAGAPGARPSCPRPGPRPSWGEKGPIKSPPSGLGCEILKSGKGTSLGFQRALLHFVEGAHAGKQGAAGSGKHPGARREGRLRLPGVNHPDVLLAEAEFAPQARSP